MGAQLVRLLILICGAVLLACSCLYLLNVDMAAGYAEDSVSVLPVPGRLLYIKL
jgi:hypothetical protein